MRIIIILLVLAAFPSLADDAVFASVGAYGEASFSDVRSDGAQRLHLFFQPASPAAVEQSRKTLAATIAIVDELEAARLIREQAASERVSSLLRNERAPGLNSHPESYGYSPPFSRWGHRFPKQPPITDIEADLPRRAFEPAFKPVEPALFR